MRERSERDSFSGDCCDDISQHEEDKKISFNLQQKFHHKLIDTEIKITFSARCELFN